MWWLTRRDKHLGLSRSRAKQLRREIIDTCAVQGIIAHIVGAQVHLQWREGYQCWRDMAPLLDDIGQSGQIARAVDEFVERTIDEETARLREKLTLAELYRRITLRLDARRGRSLDQFSLDLDRYGVVDTDAEPAATTDLNTPYLRLSLSDIAAIDSDIDTLADVARGRLCRILNQANVSVERRRSGPGGQYAYVVSSSSAHVASAPLVLEWFLGSYLPGLDFSGGVLFAVPQPSMMLVRPVTDGDDLADGLATMAGAALSLFASDELNGISPRLHMWHDSAVSTISDATDNSYLLHPPDYLVERIKGS